MVRIFFVLLLLFSFSACAEETLPLGDGKISNAPQIGYLWVCHQQKGGGGAFRDGDWIQGNVWYPGRKIQVQGDVAWPNSKLTVSVENGARVVRANDLPKHNTGVYPVQQNDPAYQYDRNPNTIREQNVLFYLPLNPEEAQYPSCTGGAVGFSLSGAWIFNSVDGEGRDAVAHEIQDKCSGHPEIKGQYHYHGPSPCMKDASGARNMHSDLVGYAFDGFGIYGLKGEGGKKLRNADLDACHGHKHKVVWDGAEKDIYHYHMTPEYPYSVGCFKGNWVNYNAEWGSYNAEWGSQGMQPAGGQQMQTQQMQGQAGNGRMQQRGSQRQQYQQQQNNPLLILQGAAQILGVNAETLRQAVGGPPPDFNQAARVLGIPADTIHAAFRKAGAPN
ncbi:MAG: YHYH protein [Alphaproteobacteria bacterium]|nr:MAG: YHYH protein [Alphaproteobacteria bacterium]